MKYIICLFACLLFKIIDVKAAEPYYFYNPGIRLGYQFGNNGGFVYGLEFSIMKTIVDYPSFGGKVSIDFCKDNTKLQLGAQVSHILGLYIGPTFYFSENKTNFGYSVGLYGTVVILPFYEYTKIFDENNFSISQTGVFLVLPVPSNNYHVSFH